MSAQTEVRILGKAYAVRSELDPQFTNDTAEIVNMKMRELSGRSGLIPTEKVAVLTAMNLAGELLKLKRHHERLRRELKTRTEKLIKTLDKQLRA